MGATHHTLPLPPRPSWVSARSPKIDPRKIRVVVPVYKDWEGLKVTLESLQALTPRPGAITVANDNEDTSVPNWLKSYPIQIVNYRNNRGPAYARNRGAENPGTTCDWIYFTDCGCEHVRNLITHFMNAQASSSESIIAVCGTVAGKGSGRINRYMTEMGILNPPFEQELGPRGEEIPQAIITANALVYAPVFHQLDGFSTAFGEAGGEDLDLGIRLRELGRLVYAPRAIVSHEFAEDLHDFQHRFERYGRANRLLEQVHKLPSLRPEPLKANPEFSDLAKLQIESLCSGYDEAQLANIVKFPARFLKRVALEILKV